MTYYVYDKFLILAPYISGVQEKNADEVPVIGLSKELVCYPLKYGFPAQTNKTQWYKDGRKIGQKGEKYRLYKDDCKIRQKDGKYQIISIYQLVKVISVSTWISVKRANKIMDLQKNCNYYRLQTKLQKGNIFTPVC